MLRVRRSLQDRKHFVQQMRRAKHVSRKFRESLLKLSRNHDFFFLLSGLLFVNVFQTSWFFCCEFGCGEVGGYFCETSLSCFAVCLSNLFEWLAYCSQNLT